MTNSYHSQGRGLFGAVMILAGCSQGYEVHEVDGTNAKFCVPKEYAVPLISWVPPERLGTPKTFAFQGCWSADPGTSVTCALPSMVRGGVVAPKSSFGGQRWQDIAADSFHKKVALSNDSVFEIEHAGSTLIVSNPRLWQDWYVWHKATPLTDETQPQLEADDELIAVCHTVKDVMLPGKWETRDMISCDRNVLGSDYALQFSFESQERAPQNLEALDAQVFEQVNRWRCGN